MSRCTKVCTTCPDVQDLCHVTKLRQQYLIPACAHGYQYALTQSTKQLLILIHPPTHLCINHGRWAANSVRPLISSTILLLLLPLSSSSSSSALSSSFGTGGGQAVLGTAGASAARRCGRLHGCRRARGGTASSEQCSVPTRVAEVSCGKSRFRRRHHISGSASSHYIPFLMRIVMPILSLRVKHK